MRKKLHRILSLALTLSLALSLTMTARAASFTDTADSPYAASISSLTEKGVIRGYNGTFRPTAALTNGEAASLLFQAFKMAPVYPMTPASEEGKEAPTKEYYSTGTTVAKLANAMMPGAPDTQGTWAFTAMNTVLESRLMEAAPATDTISGKAFALAVCKAVYGADKQIDFLAQGQKDGLLPADLKLEESAITREQAAYLLDTAIKDLTILTVFSTSDIHGNMLPYKPSGSTIEVGGSAKAAHIISEMKKIQPNVLVVDGGDSPYNTDIANKFLGQSSVDVMNATGYDATALGNHDFDYSFENLLTLAKNAKYAMLSANTFWKDGKYPEEFKPYIVKETAGIKVAIVGLVDDGSKLTTHYTNTQDINFHDQWEVGTATVAKADAESDIVILLSHLHGSNNEVPTKIKGIDVEVGGGNDTFGRPLLIADTVVVNPGGMGTVLNQLNLNLKENKMIGYTANQIILTADVPEEPTVKAILDDYKTKLDASMSEVIGKCATDLPWSSPIVRAGESALGNLAADALLAYAEADVAFQNGGGLRAGLTAGDVTLGGIFKMAPFDNRAVLMEVKGKDIWAALENGVSAYPELNGKFPQVAGIKYTFDALKPAGSRVVSITMADGKAIDLEKTYKLACNNFMAGGGDGYTMLNVLNKDTEINKDAKLIFESNDYYRNVIVEYVKKQGNIDPKVEGRITILNPQETDTKFG